MENSRFDLSDIHIILDAIEKDIAKAVMEIIKEERGLENVEQKASGADKQVSDIADGIVKTATAISNVSKKMNVSVIGTAGMNDEMPTLIKAVLTTAVAASNIPREPGSPEIDLAQIKKELHDICIDLGIDPSIVDSGPAAFS